MADLEQLAFLKAGADAWNAWRRENPSVKIDLSKADLSGSHLENFDLKGANLVHARLAGAKLAFADLDQATLSYADFSGADLTSAHMRQATAEDAVFDGANLVFADFTEALLSFSSFKDANLAHARFSGAHLIAANFHNANVYAAKFDQKILWRTLKDNRLNPVRLWKSRYDLFLDTTIRCKGIHAAWCYGSQRFKTFLTDQDYLEEMLETRRGRWTGALWWTFADCGRSLFRWMWWSVVFALAFSCVYWMLGPEAFQASQLGYSYLTLVYYSIVTFTTLGFGDVVPLNHAACFWVAFEVIVGYIMLGGLISIFANQLARRSD